MLLQETVTDPPGATEAGEAERVGPDVDPIVTVALAFADPPVPVQATEYVVVAVGETVAVPEIGLLEPVEKFVPTQEVALVEDQVSVEDWPEVVIEAGEAERVAVGRDVEMVTVTILLVARRVYPPFWKSLSS